jgi:hypothetical protein
MDNIVVNDIKIAKNVYTKLLWYTDYTNLRYSKGAAIGEQYFDVIPLLIQKLREGEQKEEIV